MYIDDSYKKIGIGILIVLIFIAMKPTSTPEPIVHQEPATFNESDGQFAVQLAENRIAILLPEEFTGGYNQNILVLEYDEDAKEFQRVNRTGYMELIEQN